MPKGVLSSHRGFLTNLHSSSAARARTALRNGTEIPGDDPLAPQMAILITTRTAIL